MVTRSTEPKPNENELNYLEILRRLEPGDRLSRYADEREAELRGQGRRIAGFRRNREATKR